MAEFSQPGATRAFGPLVEECRARGIGRTRAFELANAGIIETFHYGRTRLVILASLDALPETLAKKKREVAA